MTPNIPENNLNEDIYTPRTRGRKRRIIIITSIFFLGLLLHFPVKSILLSTIQKGLKKIPHCTIDYSLMDFHLFLPKIVMKQVTVSPNCINKSGDNYTLPFLKLHFRGISILNPGIKLLLETTIEGNPIFAHLFLSSNKQILEIEDTQIKLESLPIFRTGLVKLKGDLNIEALIENEKNKLSNGDIMVTADNILFPAQTVIFFDLPEISPKDLLLKATINKKSIIKIHTFNIGNEKSPIKVNLTGQIRLDQKAPSSSRLNLSGSFSLNDKFLEQFTFISAQLNRFKREGDKYLIIIGGTVGQPQIE